MDINMLLDNLRMEIIITASKYADFIVDSGVDSLISQSINGNYNTSYGDLVPIIIYNAIRANIVIVMSIGNIYQSQVTRHSSSESGMGTITILKTGEHYVSQRRDYFIAILMFKSTHGLAPHYLCDEITLQRDISTKSTRSLDCNNVYVPRASLACFSNAFVHRGPVIWNALPQYILKTA